MRVITEKGHEVVRVPVDEFDKFGKMDSMCDMCRREMAEESYFLPLLRKVVCCDCFESWSKSVEYFPEDTLCEQEVLSSIFDGGSE